MEAAHIYMAVLSGMVVVAFVAVLLRPEWIYEYPYFMATVFAVFIVPEAISLIRFPGEAQPEWVSDVLLMTCLCFAMCWLGYRFKPFQAVERVMARPMNPNRLFYGGLVFIGISFFFYYLLSQMTVEDKGGTMWTGPSTIYLFFANLIYPAFAICLFTALRTHSLLAWAATMVAAIQPLQAAALGGRREPTVQFLLTLALTVYFHRGIKPPRWVILVVIAGAMLAIPATGTYRGLAARQEWEGIRQMALVENFRQYLNQESILELRNAALSIEATRRSRDYEWGAGYWDQLVHRFVPAQMLGQEFKTRLMFESDVDRIANDVALLGYAIPTGSTLTGMADSFRQFGWFGCLFFAVLGVLFKSLYQATRRPDGIFAQLFYIQIGTSAMRAVTHQTVDFLPGFMYYAIFLGLLFLYARQPVQSRRATRRAHRTAAAPTGEQHAAESGESAAGSGATNESDRRGDASGKTVHSRRPLRRPGPEGGSK
jgi:hypothetical protein